MRLLCVCCLGCALFSVPTRAGESEGKFVLDTWQIASLPSGRAGHVRTTVHQIERGGKTLYRTVLHLNLTVKRFNDTIQLRMDTGTEETADGKVTRVSMTQYHGTGKSLNIVGTVHGDRLDLVLDGKKPLKSAPWDDDVIGLFRQQSLFRDRKVKPGDSFSYRSFEPTVNLVVTTRVTVKGYEDVSVNGAKQRLLRVEAVPDRIEDIQLPKLTSWLGDDLNVVRSHVEMPPLGDLVLVKSSRAQALSTSDMANLTDLGINSFIKLSRRLNQPYDATSAVYRISFSGQDDPLLLFKRDQRQQVKNVSGKTFELHVVARRGLQTAQPPVKESAEFLESCHYITSADARVKELARRAVGDEKDPWRKALRIERWVHQNMKSRNDQGLATAAEVARTLAGDCTEYAMLMAAMCRAEGVPSRTAIGLIYADVPAGPVMAFHMWTEVLTQGQWIGLDATLGKGFVGASHLKITDHSWNDTQSLTPLLPVVRVLGKLSIEVLRVGGS
jgi:predicted transglutaminase-like cysteine proteinase